jgi:hypothetical protein
VFEPLTAALDSITAAAWDAYRNHRKSPRTRRAGPEFADPGYEVAVDWLAARAAIEAAEERALLDHSPAARCSRDRVRRIQEIIVALGASRWIAHLIF